VSLAWTAAFALLGLVVLRLRMPRPARVAAPAGFTAVEPPPRAGSSTSVESPRPAAAGSRSG